MWLWHAAAIYCLCLNITQFYHLIWNHHLLRDFILALYFSIACIAGWQMGYNIGLLFCLINLQYWKNTHIKFWAVNLCNHVVVFLTVHLTCIRLQVLFKPTCIETYNVVVWIIYLSQIRVCNVSSKLYNASIIHSSVNSWASSPHGYVGPV